MIVHPASRNNTGIIVRIAASVCLLLTLGAPAQPGTGALLAAEQLRALDLQRNSQIVRLADLTVAENAVVLGTGKTAQELNARIPLSTLPTEPMKAFRAIRPADDRFEKASACLAQAVYYEAATEPLAGQRAVAQVVLNRVRHPAYPSSVCGVVYEGWDQPVCQFSFVCDGSLRRMPMAGLWRQAQDVARAALAGHVEASVGTATHYHADYVLPRWAYTLAKVDQIGRHLFYRFPGNGGRARTFTAGWNGAESIPQFDLALRDEKELPAGIVGTEVAVAPLAPDPTDRRTDIDIGGRMDPSKQWRLAIPDPVHASAGYIASRIAQGAGRDAGGTQSE